MISTRLKFLLLFVLILTGLFFFRKVLSPTEVSDQTKSKSPILVQTISQSQAQAQENPVPKQPIQETKIPGFTAEDEQKKEILEEILESRKDNDPRIDQALIHLSPEFKKFLILKYFNLAPEKRNERGLMTMLVAREVSGDNEYQFLKDVLEEKPCLSLLDCQAPSTDKDDPHHSGTDDVTLNYPQLVALYQLGLRMEKDPQILADPVSRSKILQVLESALRSDSAQVKKRAQELIQKYKL